MNNEPRLWFAVDYARRLIREGEQPARAAAFAPVLGLSADAVRALAVRAEQACAAVRVTLAAEKAGRALRGEEPTV
jgi:hypothetical protein